MCLLAFAYHASPHHRSPLVLMGNRDEFHARPTAPLAVWPESGGIVGGRDLQAGGGWLAVRGQRLAAVTNVRESPLRAAPQSRGALLAPFLSSTAIAADYASTLMAAASNYGAFNLLLFDGQQLVWASNRPTPRWQPVLPGVYGLSNAALDTPWPKLLAVRSALNDWLSAGGDATPLFTALSNPAPYPDDQLPDTGVGLAMERVLSPAFIHGPRYGTRASSLVVLGAAGFFEEHRYGPNGLAQGQTRMALAIA